MTDPAEGHAEPRADPLPAAGPVPAGERITALDALRGFAVLGILVMNTYGFAMPMEATANPLLMGGTEWYNLGTWFLTHIAFEQKFISIFSILFGAGLVIQWRRAEARDVPSGAPFMRRQFWLLVIGAVHGYLLWFGDILVAYAVVGVLVYLFRGDPPTRLLFTGIVLLVIPPLLSFGVAEQLARMQDSGSGFGSVLATINTTMSEDVEAYRSGYLDIVAYRAPEVLYRQFEGLLFYGWRIGGLMLIGMALLKLGVLSGELSDRAYLRMLALGYGLGLPAEIASAWLSWANDWDRIFLLHVGMLPNYVGSLLVAMGHTAAVMLVVKRGRLPRLVGRFTAVGRMALTSYLTHSIILTTIFYGYGFGLYGSVPRAAQMLFVIGVLAFQLWLSPLWLERFRFGPAEWLWRSLTYGQCQPMRRAA